MEILQTIWTALTTPNEGLINVLSIPLSFIEITVGMLLFTTILNINITKKQKTLYVLVLTFLSISSNTFIPNPYGTLIHMVLTPILVFFMFKTTILKSILAEVLPIIVTVLLETFIIKFYSIFINVSYDNILTIPIHRLFSVCLIYFIVFIFYKLSKKHNLNINVLEDMDKKTKHLLIFNFIIIIISIGCQFYLVDFYSDKAPLLITLLSILTLITYFFISMYSLTRTTQLQIANQDLEEAQLYNKSLKILHDNVRAFKHDFSNIVQAIGGYVGTNDIEGLKVYYSQLLGDCQKVNNLSTLSPDVINNPPIYSILTSKYHTADELGIKINLEVFLNLNTINMKIYEFTRILGILMDNAIEASRECDEKIINVEIRKDFKVNRQLLIIENTYNEKDINIDRIFEKGYSSKPDNTGLGLWEVRQILKKNNNLNLYTTKNDEFFRQQLEIYF